jgi:phosphatidylinositol phospholipase C, delta
LYSYYKNLFKTGDLILYDGMGALATLTKVESNAPFSHVGMIVRLTSRWTQETELYVIEVTRNNDKLPDAFTENPDTGIAIFRLYDRLHQFHGPSIWWAPLKTAVSEQAAGDALKWMKMISDKYKNYTPPSKSSDSDAVSGAALVSYDCLRYDRVSAMAFLEIFNLSRPTFAQLADLASPDFVGKALVKMGVLKDDAAIAKIASPADLVHLDVFFPPVALRVSHTYDQLEMLPAPLRPIHIQQMKKQGIFLRNSEQDPSSLEASSDAINDDVSRSQRRSSPAFRAATASIPSSSTGHEKMALVRRTTMLFDMSDDNLIRIMKKGCRPVRLTRKKMAEKRLLISDDETELICGNRHVELKDIVEVRVGQKTTMFDRHRKDAAALEPFSFSIMYGRRGKYGQHAHSIDLIVRTELEFKVWIAGINMLVERVSNVEEEFIWKTYRDLRRPKLNLHSTMKLLAKLNFKAPRKYVAEKFAQVDIDRNFYLDYSEFIVLLRLLRERSTLGEIFSKYTDGNPGMTPEQLQKFMKNEQDENLTADFCAKIVQKFAKPTKGKSPFVLSRADFEMYMTSGLNQLMDLQQYDTMQDMKRPLSHYFVASSHNTYLEGHQLTGSSSTEQYIQVLKQGCRCVEMDCWDGDNGEPIIYHGHTLTSKIKFENACIAIKNYAFYSTPYPVILSIENHCSVAQQTRMAQIMRSVFGEMLFESKDRASSDTSGFLPSPDMLKEKILVKGAMSARVDQMAPKYDAGGNLVAPDADDSDDDEAPKKGAKREKVSQELSEVIFLKTVGFKGFEKAKGQQPWEMSSFVETKVASLVKSDPSDFRRYNVKCLARVYPKGFRFDSSNYNTYPAWSAGCQLVAINYQTPGDPLYYNEAMFAREGGAGYILKPIHMIDPSKTTPNQVSRISIKVIDARSLPKKKDNAKRPVIDPRVSLKIVGNTADEKEWQSRVVKDNGFAPQWDESTSFDITESWSVRPFVSLEPASHVLIIHFF